MKNTIFMACRTVLSVLFLSLLFAVIINAQVKIKSRVEINIKPHAALRDSLRVIQKKSTRLTANGVSQSGNTVLIPENKRALVSEYGSSSAALIDLLISTPYESAVIPYTNYNWNETWESEICTQPTLLTLDIFWRCREYTGSQWDVYKYDLGNDSYLFCFEDIGDLYDPGNPNATDIDYNDLVVDVKIVDENVDHFNLSVIPDTILFYNYATVSALAVDQNGNEAILGNNINIALSAEPNSIGIFNSGAVARYGDLKAGRVLYEANKTQPSQTQDVSLMVSAHGKSGTGKVVVKENNVDHLVMNVERDSMMFNESTNIRVLAVDKDGNESLLGDDVNITLSASPNTIGTFYPDTVVQYGYLKYGTYYWADKIEPVKIQDVSITATLNDKSVTGKVVVKRNPCLVMSLSSLKIPPGGKVGITMQQLDCYDNLTDYPSDQLFNIWLNTGENWYGSLHCVTSGDTGTVINYVQQPFEFIAATNIDSAVVEIKAELFAGWSSSINIVTKDTLNGSTSALAKKLTKPVTSTAVPNEMNKPKLALTIERMQTWLDKMNAKQGNEKQKQKLTKKIEILKSQLAYESAKTPTEKQNALASIKQVAMLADEEAKCKQTAQVTITNGDCIRVQFANTPLSVGDTTELVFIYSDIRIPVPMNKVLDVSISVIDGTRGWILPSSGGPNTVYNGIMQPIKYIAPSDISGDSLEIFITAFKSEPGGSGNASMNIGQTVKPIISAKINTTNAENQNIDMSTIKGPNGSVIHPHYFSPATIKALLANTCPTEGDKAGAVVEPKFLPCNDQTSLSGIFTTKEPRRDSKASHGATRLVEDPENGHLFYIDPQICDNQSCKCYCLMIPIFYGNKYMVIGTCPSTAIEINSIDNVLQYSASAKKIVKSFIRQMTRINEIIENDINLPSPRKGQRLINMDDVWSYNALLEHELVHFNGQTEEKVVNPSLVEIKKQYSSTCRSKNQFEGKSKIDIEKSFAELKIKMIQSFNTIYDKKLDETDNEREIPAHKKQFNFLSKLTKLIADTYHIKVILPLPY
jgi:hypothetical protein